MLNAVSCRRNQEECTRPPTLLVNATQRLIKPCFISMLHVLLPKANDVNPTVSANILNILAELACVGGEDVMPYVPGLMQVIIAKPADPSLQKRDADLHVIQRLSTHGASRSQPDFPYRTQPICQTGSVHSIPASGRSSPRRKQRAKLKESFGSVDSVGRLLPGHRHQLATRTSR